MLCKWKPMAATAALLLALSAATAPAAAAADTPAGSGSVDAQALSAIEALIEASRHDAAIARLEDIIDRHPDAPEPRFLLGNAYTGARRFDAAIEVFSQIARDNPDRPEPYNNLAVIFVEQGRLEEARTALLTAARVQPGYAQALDNLGDVYAMLSEEAYARARAIRNADAQAGADAARTPGGALAVAATGTDPDDATADSRRQLPPLLAAAERDAVNTAVDTWALSWAAQDVEGYLNAYADDYRPPSGESHEQWRALRRERLRRPAYIDVQLADRRLSRVDSDVVEVRFRQHYRSDSYSDFSDKRLLLRRQAGEWKIALEESL